MPFEGAYTRLCSTKSVGATVCNVLLVDDDPAMGVMMARYFANSEIHVFAVGSGQQMRDVLAEEAVDLVVLDLRLGAENGLQLAQELRERSRIPIIILTGLLEEADRIMGLELGADDYLTKPVSFRELLARIRAVLRRTRMYENAADAVADVRAYRFNGWELNVRLRRLYAPDGTPIHLRNSEFNLLLAFLASPGLVLSRDQLLERSRLHVDEVYERAIDVLVTRLRKKLDVAPSRLNFIATQRGAGYRFDGNVELICV
ncbi:response regulator [Aquincola sp. J276]|uniref:response regulator n=1 Tax=Aquincola sp. J276 TaxID=2898432 RepID=UPI00215070A0|nr:response regulator [Aquincola sp. J276]MCR5868183.1 response regulator [Aquincola sp. J276]